MPQHLNQILITQLGCGPESIQLGDFLHHRRFANPNFRHLRDDTAQQLAGGQKSDFAHVFYPTARSQNNNGARRTPSSEPSRTHARLRLGLDFGCEIPTYSVRQDPSNHRRQVARRAAGDPSAGTATGPTRSAPTAHHPNSTAAATPPCSTLANVASF